MIWAIIIVSFFAGYFGIVKPGPLNIGHAVGLLFAYKCSSIRVN